jgi:hypothetical protein
MPSIQLKLFIIKSNCSIYNEYEEIIINIKKKIGEGTYGSIFEIDNDNVIKIFKNSLQDNTLLKETVNILPYSNENRELIFFNKVLDENINTQYENTKYIIKILAIGYIKHKIIDKNNIFEVNSNFIIIPLAYPFYNIYTILNKPLIKNDNYIVAINFMKRLLQICLFIETKYKQVNLDLILNNCVFNKNTFVNFDSLILLDFSLIKSIEQDPKFNKKYFDNTNYYIWPVDNDYNLSNIHSYSICINGLELLFGRDEIKSSLPSKNKINYYLKILRNLNENVYELFLNGLSLKIDTKSLLELINKLFE